MAPADYTLREVGNALIVSIDADNLLGVLDVTRIGNKLNELIKDPPHHVVLDLSNVRYAGSASLGMLLSLSKSLQDRGRRLILVGTQHLDTLFKVSRTVAVLDLHKDVNAAIQSLQR